MHTDSPFRQLREKTGLTAALFAAEADLSRQAVTNLEAGMYTSVPLRANRTLATVCSDRGIDARAWLHACYGVSKLDEAMDAWKKEKRALLDLSDWPVLTLKEIIARFKSPGTFCRDLCIPTSAIYHAIYGKSTVVPDVIREALHDAGYRYAEWQS